MKRDAPKWNQHGRPVGTALRAVRDAATAVALVPVVAATWLKRKLVAERKAAEPEEALYGCYAKPAQAVDGEGAGDKDRGEKGEGGK